jgi:hypothetical protein
MPNCSKLATVFPAAHTRNYSLSAKSLPCPQHPHRDPIPHPPPPTFPPRPPTCSALPCYRAPSPLLIHAPSLFLVRQAPRRRQAALALDRTRHHPLEDLSISGHLAIDSSPGLRCLTSPSLAPPLVEAAPPQAAA